MRSETAARIVFSVLLALNLYLMYLIFRPFLPGIAWAVVLAVAFWPTYDRLVRWFRGRAWLAATLLSALVAAFIVVPIVLAVVKVGQGVVEAYGWLDSTLSGEGWGLGRLRETPPFSDLIPWLESYVDLQRIDLKTMGLSALRTAGNTLAGNTRALVTNAFGTLLTLVVLLVTMTFLLHEGPRLVEVVRRFLPLSEDDKKEVFANLQTVTRSVFYGVLLTALVQSILGGIGLAIVGLPAITLGAAMFFCALLPGGPTLVWLPAAGWLFLSGHTVKGVFLLIWGAAVVGSVDNFLRPLFIQRGVRMHLLLVFFGIFGGMAAFGLIGLFTGPLVITLFFFLLEVARRDFFRTEPERPAAE